MEVKEPGAKYVARRGYKQTEIGMIPEHWDLRPLGELFHFSGGFSG